MSVSPRPRKPAIPHPSAMPLQAIEEAAYRGAMRAIEDAGVATAHLTPEAMHRGAGFSTKRLATEAGTSHATVYRIERGRLKRLEQGTIEICMRIAAVIGARPEDYLRIVQSNIERRGLRR